MKKKSITDVDLNGKRVVIRCDFNVPLDKKTSEITNDLRIRASLPTIEHCLKEGARVVLCSHLGRPDGQRNDKMSLQPVGARLAQLLSRTVATLDDCVGGDVEAACRDQGEEIILLENLRFHPEEEDGDKDFAKQLASLADVFVNDAFGAAHRAHASVSVVGEFVPVVAGFLVQKEIDAFASILFNPHRPVTAILGGAKIRDKIPLIENLLDKVDKILVGGAMAYTFLKAKGHGIGNSMLDDEHLEDAARFLKLAVEKEVDFRLPVDHIVASSFDSDFGEATEGVEIPPGKLGMDIGPKTVKEFREVILASPTIVWNGPMGVFERNAFSHGTLGVAKALAECGGVTVIGGGDSASAIEKFGFADKVTHVSTGGGASMELLEGKTLPGIAVLQDAT
ncbi:MAG: phosphoglycerate kinase [Planctomycetes bacterium]|nr:phosphoglycerate kinase [Planctomycetota bacterium]